MICALPKVGGAFHFWCESVKVSDSRSGIVLASRQFFIESLQFLLQQFAVALIRGGLDELRNALSRQLQQLALAHSLSRFGAQRFFAHRLPSGLSLVQLSFHGFAFPTASHNNG